MGEVSAIEWTDATWNPWRGCDKVSPGCAHCYMFDGQRRFGRDPSVVVRAASGTFKAPLSQKWLLRAEEKRRQGLPHLVFTCSWSDWFHEDADPWRDEAWAIIRETAALHTFQILTKRPERILERLPEDWGDGYPNVWLGVSIENRRFVDRADILRETPAALRFISAEPLLGPLAPGPGETVHDGLLTLDLVGIDWLIVGGESGPKARPMNLGWARDLRDACTHQCRDCAASAPPDWRPGFHDDRSHWAPCERQTAFFFKQWGGARHDSGGRELDGRTWDEMPETTKGAAWPIAS